MTATSSPQPALTAILAGGAGSRLGGNKACVELAGRPLIDYPLAAARSAHLDALVVAKRAARLPKLDCEVLVEPDLRRHPLCGIIAALRYADGRAVLALACDMPFLSGPLLSWMAHLEGAAVACLNGSPQPLLARWVPEQLPALERALDGGTAMRELVESLSARMLDESELRSFGDPDVLCFNVNDARDLAQADAIARAAA